MCQPEPQITQLDFFEAGPRFLCSGLSRTIATVMITDIEDSTGLARTLGVTGIAAFLKRHLGLVRDVMEGHRGTILDYTGDGVCAFWNNALPNRGETAILALSAAAELAERIAEDNRRLSAIGHPTRRVRLGLNSGEIALERPASPDGAPRIYGATVHEARRIEQSGKNLSNPCGDVIMMASQATLQLAEFELAAKFGKKYPASLCQSLGFNGAIFSRKGMQTAARDCFAVPLDPRVIAALLCGGVGR